jgi:hypothetical protein
VSDRFRVYLEAAIGAFVDAIGRGDMEGAEDALAVAFGWAAELEGIGGAA